MKPRSFGLLDKEGKRVDGRGPNDLRPVRIECGIIKRADGSTLFEQGKTKVIAAVYGPRGVVPKHQEIPNRALLRCRYSMLPFSTEERKQPAPTRREIELSRVVREALEASIFTEKYPRTEIAVYVEVLNADAGTRCAAISAGSVALANAGIALRDLVSSCAVGKVEGKLVLDPCGEEDNYGEADLAVAMMPQFNEMTLLQLDGKLTREELNHGMEMAFEASRKIYVKQMEALKDQYVRVSEAVGGGKVE
ncbi:MAG: exosome complex exonuclease Rrp41 [Candidatus Bathyarchaeia archaeon]